ncbi:hybrid sensor histidine kinase/response regulator [Xaviernesmea oryzae]|uniref:histidine kinase n=1 Tax=Xaviernesmea oryzae TaxID=464029 RepID=A0A1Q9B1P1_9HYPH|nr:hybrid sensor histidine kinase/response regulator [Xaviernesmea oryzae]OLP61939.1 hybrid sensor histidine kinase/response regulator [Xaviernesmea oryzae]SEL00539.1 PAS domain S-box-containing protein [Xaviernesmea oryzae]
MAFSTSEATPISSQTEVALIYAPNGRDSAVAAALIRECGTECQVTGSLHELAQALGDHILFAVVVDEALRSADLAPLNHWVTSQPRWSDLPFIVLTHRNSGPERNPAAARISEALGNVSFLERPFHPTTFVSVVASALKNRQRQFEARKLIGELNESALTLKTALLAGHLGTWTIELPTWSLTSSEEFRQIFGRNANDNLSYQDLLAAIHPHDRSLRNETLVRTLTHGDDYIIEYRVIWPDQSIHWAEVRGRLARASDGTPERLVGVATDITARKHAEASLRSLNETLERRVEERTLALRAESAQRESAEQKLRQSQKLEAIGQLTGGVAHDFNNLLMAVLGNLDLARKYAGADAKMTRLIDGALQGARRGASLTQRLLAFARRQDLEVTPTDLSALVGNMQELLLRSVGSGVRIESDPGSNLPLVLVDANQIELALLNLVVNARDAMPEGGTVSISVDFRDSITPAEGLPHGAYLCLRVSDTGSGMDDETLRRAIDPFFSTKELGKGTGLGLSMVHGLAEQLQGTLKLSSTVGTGTVAELWLPVTQQTLHVAAEPAADVVKPAPAATILLVDDDALIAMSSVDMLEDLGHRVFEANSGKDALAILEREAQIDVMITDFSMPGMNGAQLAAAAREKRPDLPILLATGYADLPPGFNFDIPRLGKPYTQEQLEKELDRLLSRRGS